LKTDLFPTKGIILVTGHFGSGKTNVSVNMALSLAAAGHKVNIIDFDIINPYFRSADNLDELRAAGVRCIIPQYANTNVDIPSLPSEIYSVFERKDECTIFDVGGDSIGAAAISTYKRYIENTEHVMYNVINMYRPITETPNDVLEIVSEIEERSRFKTDALINNSNLGAQTDPSVVSASFDYAKKCAELCGIPLLCTSCFEENAPKTDTPLFLMKNKTKRIW